MSADNGIYLLKSLDGYRVVHTQAIENIYWHYICCDNPNIIWEDDINGYLQEKCINCKSIDPKSVQKDELSSYMIKVYFGNSEVFKTQDEALERAEILYGEGYCEYGICFITGWEDKPFPK